MSDSLSRDIILSHLQTERFGRTLLFWPVIGSTNDELKRMAEQGAAEGTVAVADHQSQGRGRMQRSWLAPPGSGLLISILFRPAFLQPELAAQITMICSLAAADAITQVTGLPMQIKWPNDLLLCDKKAAGILTELGFSAGPAPNSTGAAAQIRQAALDWAVVGIGINVNVAASNWPAGLEDIAISLSQVLVKPVSRLEILGRLLEHVETRYAALRSGCSPHDEWAARLSTLGKWVTANTLDASYQGVVEGVDPTGAILLRQENGQPVSILAGDILPHNQAPGHKDEHN